MDRIVLFLMENNGFPSSFNAWYKLKKHIFYGVDRFSSTTTI